MKGLLVFVRALPGIWSIRNEEFTRIGLWEGAEYYEYRVMLPDKPRAFDVLWEALRER